MVDCSRSILNGNYYNGRVYHGCKKNSNGTIVADTRSIRISFKCGIHFSGISYRKHILSGSWDWIGNFMGDKCNSLFCSEKENDKLMIFSEIGQRLGWCPSKRTPHLNADTKQYWFSLSFRKIMNVKWFHNVSAGSYHAKPSVRFFGLICVLLWDQEYQSCLNLPPSREIKAGFDDRRYADVLFNGEHDPGGLGSSGATSRLLI